MNNGFFKVLKIASFRNLWLAQLFSQVFLNLLFFSLMIRVYDLTKSNSAVGFVVLLVTLPNIILGALAGVLVDRGDRKIVMFFCHFVRIFVVLAFLFSTETLGWLYILILLISVITQFFFPAEAAIIHELVSDKKLLLSANSLFTITFFGSVIAGNVLAGPILSLFGVSGTFVIVALAFVLASFFTARLPGQSIRLWISNFLQMGISAKLKVSVATWKGVGLFSDFLVGLDHIYKSKDVRNAILALGASQVVVSVLGTMAPGFADKILHLSSIDISVLVMAPAALGMILGAVFLSQFFHKWKYETTLRIGLFALFFGLILYSLVDILSGLIHAPTLLVNIFLLLILGAANALLTVPGNTVIQENTPEEVRSRVYGVVNAIVGLAAIIPIVLSGVLADIIGVRAVMVIISLVMGLFAIARYL